MSPAQRIEELLTALQGPLPGDDAKAALRPRPVSSWRGWPEETGVKKAAVLLLLIPTENEIRLPLIRRSQVLGDRHSGQISLPGGGAEEGESPEETALREAHEELGIEPTEVEVLGRLSPQTIPVSGYRVLPVVGRALHPPSFRTDPQEVERLVLVSLDALADPARRRIIHRRIDGVDVEIPGWPLEEGLLWGATAMILAELLALLEPRHHPS